MDTSDELTQILQNIEDEQASKKIAETISYLNKPEKIAISSNNAEQESNIYSAYTGNGFNSFTINLPRGALNVKSIELLNANIPQAQASIPDECLIFYYYKIKSQTNYDNTSTIFHEQPNINNIHYIRLLPSYYKPELIIDSFIYAYNRTFNSYQDLESELYKACANDLYYNNYIADTEKFLPNDISITFNEELNRFQMTGNNVFTPWSDVPIWIGDIDYHVNDIVSYNGIIYICIQDNGNIEPPSDSYWLLYTSPFYTYFLAGYEDPNVFTFSQTLQELFKSWDFDYSNYTGSAFNALSSIPPQPIKQYQTLNLRLGFTFNGIYNWSDNMIVGINSNNGSDILISLFNRLRPVPIYRAYLALTESITSVDINNTPYINPTYTADSYANLVYSSIVSIYCSFIGPSTTDTQRNTNLLSIVPLSANNLGITFYEPKISNKLTKITKDIYSMFFEFRREDGEVYYFPNSAIITLQLGLTYD